MDLQKLLSLYAVLLTSLLYIASARELGLRSLLKCGTCNPDICPKLPTDCELVREPGYCSCCLTCARTDGESCGLTTGRCGRGMKCRPLPGDPEPLLAMMYGRAYCSPIKVVPNKLFYYIKNETV